MPLRRHIANGLDLVVWLFGEQQIAAELDRSGVPYIVLNGFTREFPGALAATFTQNVVTYTATIADLGASNCVELALLTGTAENALVTNATRVVTETGTVTFEVAYPFLDGKILAKLVADNACATAAWQTETPVLEVNMVDYTTYTWNEGVTEGEWTDPANWTASIDNPYALYPNSSKARANFKNCTVPTTVYVNGTVVVDVIQDQNNNALDLTFTRSPNAASATIHVWATWWDGFGDSTVTIDGINHWCHDGKYMNLAYLKVTNGATFETAQETQWHKSGAVLEVSKGSLWLQTDWTLSMTGDGSKFILDDSTFRSKGEIWCPRNNLGSNNIIEVRGENPAFDCTGFVAGRDSQSESGPTIVFFVPENGYATAPFSRANGGSFNPKLPMNIVVDPSSPAMRVAKKRVQTKLIDYPKGYIQAINNISFAAQKRAGTISYRYTYGTDYAAEPATEGALPTALWIDIVQRPTVIVIR